MQRLTIRAAVVLICAALAGCSAADRWQLDRLIDAALGTAPSEEGAPTRARRKTPRRAPVVTHVSAPAIPAESPAIEAPPAPTVAGEAPSGEAIAGGEARPVVVAAPVPAAAGAPPPQATPVPVETGARPVLEDRDRDPRRHAAAGRVELSGAPVPVSGLETVGTKQATQAESEPPPSGLGTAVAGSSAEAEIAAGAGDASREPAAALPGSASAAEETAAAAVAAEGETEAEADPAPTSLGEAAAGSSVEAGIAVGSGEASREATATVSGSASAGEEAAAAAVAAEAGTDSAPSGLGEPVAPVSSGGLASELASADLGEAGSGKPSVVATAEAGSAGASSAAEIEAGSGSGQEPPPAAGGEAMGAPTIAEAVSAAGSDRGVDPPPASLDGTLPATKDLSADGADPEPGLSASERPQLATAGGQDAPPALADAAFEDRLAADPSDPSRIGVGAATSIVALPGAAGGRGKPTGAAGALSPGALKLSASLEPPIGTVQIAGLPSELSLGSKTGQEPAVSTAAPTLSTPLHSAPVTHGLSSGQHALAADAAAGSALPEVEEGSLVEVPPDDSPQDRLAGASGADADLGLARTSLAEGEPALATGLPKAEAPAEETPPSQGFAGAMRALLGWLAGGTDVEETPLEAATAESVEPRLAGQVGEEPAPGAAELSPAAVLGSGATAQTSGADDARTHGARAGAVVAGLTRASDAGELDTRTGEARGEAIADWRSGQPAVASAEESASSPVAPWGIEVKGFDLRGYSLVLSVGAKGGWVSKCAMTVSGTEQGGWVARIGRAPAIEATERPKEDTVKKPKAGEAKLEGPAVRIARIGKDRLLIERSDPAAARSKKGAAEESALNCRFVVEVAPPGCRVEMLLARAARSGNGKTDERAEVGSCELRLGEATAEP